MVCGQIINKITHVAKRSHFLYCRVQERYNIPTKAMFPWNNVTRLVLSRSLKPLTRNVARSQSTAVEAAHEVSSIDLFDIVSLLYLAG